jgi:DNA-binding NarL/FixJ family response regulator
VSPVKAPQGSARHAPGSGVAHAPSGPRKASLRPVSGTRRPSGRSRVEPSLTPRESQILEAIADGLTNVQVAHHLGLAPSTVASHVETMLAAAHVPNRAALVALGIRLGWLQPGVPESPAAADPFERLLAGLVAQGWPTARIAQRTGRDTAGVEAAIGRLGRRLGASTRAHLVRRAADAGVLPSTVTAAAGCRYGASVRQVQVLELIARGLSNPEIAERLGVSVHTVKTHVRTLLASWSACSRTELVAMGLRSGVIAPPVMAPVVITPRRRTALEYAAWGYTARGTAVAMGVADNTVKGLWWRGRYALGARDAAHAVWLGVGAGVLRLEDLRPIGGSQ